MEIKPIYVTFKQAELLKEKGFDVEVNSEILTNGFVNHHGIKKNWNFEQGFYSAPEHWQVIEWLRIKHGIQIFLDYFFYDGFHYGCKYTKSNGESGEIWIEGDDDIDGALTQQEAYSKTFDYIFKNL